MKLSIEMNYCRRCGGELANQQNHIYKCAQGHIIFCNASPAVGVLLFNNKGEVLILERAIDPGKGMLDAPGGFCDGAETLEDAIARELKEETAIGPELYSAPQFICSGIDDYEYGGEAAPVNGVMFRAQLKQDVKPVAADDAMSAQFMALEAIDLDKVYFLAVRKALAALRS